MDHRFIEAHEYVVKAREALRRGDRESARKFGEQAALRAPEMEDAWLVLAASDPSPEEALAYARKALALKPASTRARKAVEWALKQFEQVQGRAEQSREAERVSAATAGSSLSQAVVALKDKQAYQTAVPFRGISSKRVNWHFPALLAVAACMLVGLMGVFVLANPALVSVARSISLPRPTQENLWAPVEIAKPGNTPIGGNAFAPQQAAPPASALQQAQDGALPATPFSASPIPTKIRPTATPSSAPTSTFTEIPTDPARASPTLQATQTPAVLAMEIVPDTPTSEYVPVSPSDPDPALASSGARWIDVDLSEQRVYAYEGDVIVNSFVVSTGTWRTPTVTGKFKVYIRLRSGDMRGPGYYLPDVPYIMYFHGDYGLHGTYWHSNFGTPMSHGCVNLSIDDAAWLYNWSHLGTVVNVHN